MSVARRSDTSDSRGERLVEPAWRLLPDRVGRGPLFFILVPCDYIPYGTFEMSRYFPPTTHMVTSLLRLREVL